MYINDWLLNAIMSYAIGSIPFGWILVKLFKGFDLRERGSGGIGTTNVGREAGKLLATITMLLDVGKGFCVTYGTQLLGWTEEKSLVFGFMACLGHCFPIVLGGKGGKAVASALGVLLASAWQIGLIAFIVWATVTFVTKVVSKASIAAVCVVLALAACWPNLPILERIMIALLMLLIIVMHKSNIERIRRGEENQFHFAENKHDP